MSKKPAPPKLPVLALVGRPNVGKSTLFNVLSTGSKALVHNVAGTTRDARLERGALDTLRFMLLDTAGMELTRSADELAPTLTRLATAAAQRADVLLFMVDGAAGLLPADIELARALRKLGKPVIPVITKGDLNEAEDHAETVEALGFGTPVLLSAAHRTGLSELFAALEAYCPVAGEDTAEEGASTGTTPPPQPLPPQTSPSPHINLTSTSVQPPQTSLNLPDNPEDMEELAPPPPAPLRFTIVGRPNTGKSTLTNALLRQEAMLTGPTAGLTREAITHEFTYKNQQFILTDTPGMRRKARITEALETQSVAQAVEAIEKSDIVLLLVDASTYRPDTGKWQVFDQQDTKIAATILNQNKPLLTVLTKWDLVEDKEECLDETLYQLARRMQLVQAPHAVPISALKGKGIKTLLDALLTLHNASRQTVSTGKLNRLLGGIVGKRPPPLANRGEVKLKFIRQIAVNPPMLAIWGSRVSQLPDSYKLYLRNQLATALGWQAVPLKILFKANKNPFAEGVKNPRKKR